MGTLTADCPRLDSHCPHKLATSCRLTSTPNCCACADQRAHSSTYRVYIDGVGFVQRGTRWQSYCWFCKEFWNNRLASTDPPLDASQTRIPLIPDQTEFLARWFEFHQGYRIIRQPDGTETRIAVLGEPLDQVSPGFLPRTLDQLRAGRQNNHLRAENRFRRPRLSSEEDRPEPEEPQRTIEDALDDLLDEVSDDEPTDEVQPSIPAAAPAPAPEPQDMSLSQSQQLNRTELSLNRARERINRVFGTHEDVQRDDYESPISNMYNRAYARYRQAEARREAGDTIVPPLDSLTQQERREIEDQIVWGVLHDSRRAQRGQPSSQQHSDQRNAQSISPQAPDGAVPGSATSSSSNIAVADLIRATEGMRWIRQTRENAEQRHHLPTATLDQPTRPPPLSDGELKKDMSCHVCYCQLADTALLPCGHMVMCKWCADVVIPVRHGHIPERHAKCPMCRKGVKQRVRIHIG